TWVSSHHSRDARIRPGPDRSISQPGLFVGQELPVLLRKRWTLGACRRYRAKAGSAARVASRRRIQSLGSSQASNSKAIVNAKRARALITARARPHPDLRSV